VNRREFLVAGSAAALGRASGGTAPGWLRSPKRYFGVHPLIERNPKAVFIRRTNVPHKMDEAAKLREGLSLAREIFVPLDQPGIPISHRIVLKPNASGARDTRPLEENWGVGTDPQFYEGIVKGLQELGLRKFHFIESTGYETWDVRGFNDINERLGVEINEPTRRPRHLLESFETNWHTVPGGVVFKRIPHYAPVGEPDTWLLNISKWKAHSMSLTLAVKNEQGLVAHPFTSFCGGWDTVLGMPDWVKPEINLRVEAVINASFERHRKMGYARYDAPGNMRYGREPITPMRQEIWAQKTCDNLSTLTTGLSIIEGIYARDGNGWTIGNDYLTNLVLFGKDKFRLDTIGLYLGGHEPGNIHYLRIGKERGLSDTFNPWEIPIYEWVDGAAAPCKLTDFQRTPLKTPYLQRAGEPEYHLVDERFDYERHTV
jgi:uncharacterized protein (DUF362 family)